MKPAFSDFIPDSARPVYCAKRVRGLQATLVSSALALLLAGSSPKTASAQLTIDDPNGVGSTVLAGMDGNNVVGFYTDSMMNDHGFIYNGQNFVPLDDPAGVSTDPFAISGNTVVGSYTDSMGVTHGFLNNGAGFTTLDPTGSIETEAYGISGNKVVGDYVDSMNNVYGFLYDGSRRRRR